MVAVPPSAVDLRKKNLQLFTVVVCLRTSQSCLKRFLPVRRVKCVNLAGSGRENQSALSTRSGARASQL